jgi:hypothetical protein
MAPPPVAKAGDTFRYEGYIQIRVQGISETRQPTMGETPACGFGEGPTAAHGKRTRNLPLRNVTQGIGLGRLLW